MKKLTSFLRKWRIGQILTVFLSSLLLLVTTACNAGTATGARPQNPPVQAGASVDSQSNASKMLYPGSEPLATDKFDQELGGNKAILNETGGAPKQRQPIIDRSNPDAQILERVGATFKDASSFLKDSTQEGVEKTFTKGTPLQK